jgi:GNAT superfamily N-acetyltransferase
MSEQVPEFLQVESDEERAQAGRLIREYLVWLDDRIRRTYALEFDVDAMLQSDLSGSRFQPPEGRFYLVRLAEQTAGVGCLSKLEEGVGELQRMYVLPKLRGRGVARALAARLIDDARSIGYRQLRLESLEFLDAAHALYRSLGFRTIPRYARNSMQSYQSEAQLDRYHSITVFMEMDL